MLSFKPKTTKKIKVNKKNSTTLDGKHREFINDFNKDEQDRIPKLKIERNELREKLSENEISKSMTIEQVMEFKDRIEEINEKIRMLKNKKMDYFLDNSKYIFDYFENKKNISNVDNNNTNKKTKILDDFFKINKDNDNSKMRENKNNNIFQKYLSNIDESFIDINSFVVPTDVCQGCHKGELIPMDDEGVLICNYCSRNFQYLIENEKPSYKEPPKEVCFYAYKKINHFKEILAQFQGKETTQIPVEVIENLKQQIKKERIEIMKITYYETKALLKKLGYNKYYEHINFIKDKLGIKPPIISQELEETLCNFFMEIQYPYAKHCPDYRVNFLHYYYVLYQLFELLGEKHYLAEIPMLKDREKLIEQDSVWKKICEELDWEFIPTV
uniref:Viral late gene transcription factor 3 zinc ribbon domain-containing protein n=1 Tax=viral metagenome TaxID=1070528 RepID=A0A6C0KXW6_9ZZZZ